MRKIKIITDSGCDFHQIEHGSDLPTTSQINPEQYLSVFQKYRLDPPIMENYCLIL